MEEQIVTSKFEIFIEWARSIWEKVNIQQWAEDIGGSSADAVQAAIHFGLGFAIGFLFKKYFKFVFFTLLTSFLVVLVLEYNQVLNIDWSALNVLLGFDPSADVGIILNTTFDWIKSNLITFVSATVGFLIGYKLG